MNAGELEKQVTADRNNGFVPFMVIGTCGTTTAGVIDPLPELGRFCRDADLWLHVDAAWGGAAVLSPMLRDLLSGIELADSITCDAHKWLSVPMGCGMFFCRHPESAIQAFRAEAAYMPAKASGPAFDPYTTSVQWSRRFIGLKLFLSLAKEGESGLAAMIEHQTRMGDVLRDALSASGWRIINETQLPVICFTRDGLDIPQFLASLHEKQIAWMSEARIKGAPVMRACITSFRTSEEDVRWVVNEMNRIAARHAADKMASA
jgi:glutamate/tyrosine decarboxylase-like PLP-dependent enzyme